MNDIEKRARELFEAARGLYNATIGDPAVTIRCESAASRDAVAAAGERLRRALLDQGPALIPADHPQVITSSAAGAYEVQPEAVDVGLDLAESGEPLAAADALEHEAGVRPEGDGQATADHVADGRKLVERARELLAAELRKDYGPASAQYVLDGHDDGCTTLRAIIAALTPPEGYVLVPVDPTEAMLRAGSWVEPPYAHGQGYIEKQGAAQCWKLMMNACPGVKP